MKNVTSFAWPALLLAGVVLIAGCAPQTVERDARYKVTGTVTLNGKAVEGATVAFSPKGEGAGATGLTDAQGKYSLSTYGADDGALPGDYAIKITKMEGGAVQEGSGSATAEGDEQYPSDYDGAAPEEEEEPAKNLLPAKYADPSTSGFDATVEANDNNVFDFSMEGAAE